jgi:RNA polymerase sigma-70 factor (ECF subfamily)
MSVIKAARSTHWNQFDFSAAGYNLHVEIEMEECPVRLSAEDAKAIEAEIPYLRRYARVLAGRPDAADDLVQDGLERAIRRFGQFREGTNLRAWLFTILHNIRCDQYRRAVRRGPEVPLEHAPMQMSERANQADALHLRDFRRAFDQLSEPHRQVLALVGIEGMSYDQVAEILDVEVGTVKSRVFRARESLRREQQLLASPKARHLRVAA